MAEIETLETPELKQAATYQSRFAEGRKAANASQGVVAKGAGVSTQAISQFERGVQSLTIDVFLKACAAIGLRTEWVLHGAGQQFEGSRPQLGRKGGRKAGRKPE